jgi:hypothetical protein
MGEPRVAWTAAIEVVEVVQSAAGNSSQSLVQSPLQLQWRLSLAWTKVALLQNPKKYVPSLLDGLVHTLGVHNLAA